MDEYISFSDEMHPPLGEGGCSAKKNSTFLCCTIFKKCNAYFPSSRMLHAPLFQVSDDHHRA